MSSKAMHFVNWRGQYWHWREAKVQLGRLGRNTLTLVFGKLECLEHMLVPPHPPHAWRTSGISFEK
jgi:hypothetical protein